MGKRWPAGRRSALLARPMREKKMAKAIETGLDDRHRCRQRPPARSANRRPSASRQRPSGSGKPSDCCRQPHAPKPATGCSATTTSRSSGSLRRPGPLGSRCRKSKRSSTCTGRAPQPATRSPHPLDKHIHDIDRVVINLRALPTSLAAALQDRAKRSTPWTNCHCVPHHRKRYRH